MRGRPCKSVHVCDHGPVAMAVRLAVPTTDEREPVKEYLACASVCRDPSAPPRGEIPSAPHSPPASTRAMLVDRAKAFDPADTLHMLAIVLPLGAPLHLADMVRVLSTRA